MSITIPSTPVAGTGASIALPAHAIGDIIIIFAYRDGSTTVPTKPAAAGTVPAWVDARNLTGTNSNSARSAYFVATATNHTSGTWTNATGMAAIVLRGQAVSPIGGASDNGHLEANTVTGQAITMTRTDGTSALLYFYAHRTVTAWGAAPSGYTRQASVATECCLNTKDDTTSDGAQAQSCTATSSGNEAMVVEILAAPVFSDSIRNAVNRSFRSLIVR